MTDKLLFNLPAEGPPALESARARYARAAQEWDECLEMDNSPIRQRIGAELFDARHCLALLESREIERRAK